MNIADAVAQVEAELRAQGDPVRAESEKRYLKSDFVHLGVPMAPLRKVARSVVKVEPSRVDLLALAETLWSVAEGGRPIHEMRMASIEVLIRRVNLLGPGDLGLAETLIRDSASWVYVDHLAEKIVGGLVLAFPEQVGVLDRWVSDPYFWIRRTSLLALLPGVRAGEPDLERISRYGDALIGEKEFFIRKALGWVLRELTKKGHAEWVTAWVGERTDRISGVAIREAVRHLPETDGERLLAAYKTR
ncbi:DNA alkylation repair protein [Actinomadura barringtoniae]|uniref:DNA alkylation repair protein n=1 Tax=Actinomadura barringtoniae TaxID=1427535 RepID=A0A939TDE0_9ACTN|nr:DNA alkylation repair protein [Actinomadura barringtoniae]MBO2452200.1 DNA alkylation repair protein [Actinomadura barringtoniae]